MTAHLGKRKMNGHGGRRENAGRNPVPVSLRDEIEIVSRCRYLYEGFRKEIAEKRIEKAIPASIKNLQNDMHAKHARAAIRGAKSAVTRKVLVKQFTRIQAHVRKRIEEEIASKLPKTGRLIKSRKFMPKRPTREQVRQQVAEEWNAKGRPDITARRIKDIWAASDELDRHVRAHLNSQS